VLRDIFPSDVLNRKIAKNVCLLLFCAFLTGFYKAFNGIVCRTDGGLDSLTQPPKKWPINIFLKNRFSDVKNSFF
jgi:hypothetical protein